MPDSWAKTVMNLPSLQPNKPRGSTNLSNVSRKGHSTWQSGLLIVEMTNWPHWRNYDHSLQGTSIFVLWYSRSQMSSWIETSRRKNDWLVGCRRHAALCNVWFSFALRLMESNTSQPSCWWIYTLSRDRKNTVCSIWTETVVALSESLHLTMVKAGVLCWDVKL